MEILPKNFAAANHPIGFGTFKKAQRAARKGRNPQTGEVIDIAASESLAFKSSVKY